MASQEWTDYDIFLFRQFCADELRKHVTPMRDFWAHASSYKEREPGEHPLLDSAFVGSVGYRIEKRNRKDSRVRGIAAYPFVRTRALNMLPSDGSKRFVMRKALDEPLRVEEFWCVLDGDKRIAFLTEEAYGMTLLDRSCEACVLLGREEACAILAGETLERTRKKLVRVFDMDDGEWLRGGF